MTCNMPVAEQRAKRYTHVPFDSMTCPVPRCGHYGSVPGIKRHVGFMHPSVRAHFPPTRTVDGLVNNFLADEDKAEEIVAELGVQTTEPDGKLSTWEDIALRVLAKLEK